MATQGMELRRSLSDAAKPLCLPVAPEQQVSLTVRTLDKAEHQISVAYDIPVPQLKSKVATITSIDADSQRLVSDGQEMSHDLRLSDYCATRSHIIYLVVRFPGVGCALAQHGNDSEEVEGDGATSHNAHEVSTQHAPRIVLHGTVTIPVPERDVHRVVHSLMGSQTSLNEFVSSMAYGDGGQFWNTARRGQGGAARPCVPRRRQLQGRRGHAARRSVQRTAGQHSSVNLSFRGYEWESMHMWPNSIDYHAGLGDDFLYDPMGEPSLDGFRMNYPPSMHHGALRPLSSSDEVDVPVGGRCDFTPAMPHLDESSFNDDPNDSYLSANRTLIADDGDPDDPGDPCDDRGIHHLTFGSCLAADEGLNDAELHWYDDGLQAVDNDPQLGHLVGKRKYEEMCSSPVIPHRSAPRCRSVNAAMLVPIRSEPAAAGSGELESPAEELRAAAIDEAERDRFSMHDREHANPAARLLSGSVSTGAQHRTACPGYALGPGASSSSSDVRATIPPYAGRVRLPEAHQAPQDNSGESWSRPSSCGFNGRSAPAQCDTQAGREHLCAQGDPLAAAEVHGIDSQLSSLSLQLQDSPADASSRNELVESPVALADAPASRGHTHAVYKTHPEPLALKAEAGASGPVCEAASATDGGVRTQRNASDPAATPVKTNQCCAVM